MKKFKRVLIANRGEIAVRIARTATRLGLEPIIIYSDADRYSLAVREAKEAYRLGGNRVTESYIDADRVLAIARESKADAIHPGYGLLSENSAFARRVIKEGFVWIGPSPDAMDAVASKSKAKELAIKAGIPVSPGFQGKQDPSLLAKEALKIGCPLLIKAAAGGGGRGIRKVESESQLQSMLEAARSEAVNSFGDGELILEKYIEEANHVEVQIFGDESGTVVHMGERDCSVQRRHQKIIEEAPSSALTPELREKITSAAVSLARAAKYTNAGTVEFLVTPKKEFYFLEMNTRLQVEHPVTELVTGLDLVEWQFRIADGETVPLEQLKISFKGHSIQARLYAEDPDKSYQPQTGRIEHFEFPNEVRVDHFLTPSAVITSFYDAMLAKIIVHAKDRGTAIKYLSKALDRTLVVPLTTNRQLLTEVLLDQRFQAGTFYTRTLDQSPLKSTTDISEAFETAALLFYSRSREAIEPHLIGWSTRPAAIFVTVTDGKMKRT